MDGVKEVHRPTVTHKGQPYYHEKIFARPKGIVIALRRLWGYKPFPDVLVGHQKVNLKWVKPHELQA